MFCKTFQFDDVGQVLVIRESDAESERVVFVVEDSHNPGSIKARVTTAFLPDQEGSEYADRLFHMTKEDTARTTALTVKMDEQVPKAIRNQGRQAIH
ncbi:MULTISPECIES: hypothetical protein [unclassified Thioalkalivibrio]|uniref:hypothetical protein n=1 Tax=unclassified Thioalkalivibrio TaxID=2621013 RepID=UPI00036473B4|nr:MULTISPECIES: hypothetical protein [unclassified Thioalkalivibrio]